MGGTRHECPDPIHSHTEHLNSTGTDELELTKRYRGCLLGLAAGDALGTTVEFSEPGTFAPITDMIGGGPFRLRPGEWTDDTSMALCLAESLLARGNSPGRQSR